MSLSVTTTRDGKHVSPQRRVGGVGFPTGGSILVRSSATGWRVQAPLFSSASGEKVRAATSAANPRPVSSLGICACGDAPTRVRAENGPSCRMPRRAARPRQVLGVPLCRHAFGRHSVRRSWVRSIVRVRSRPPPVCGVSHDRGGASADAAAITGFMSAATTAWTATARCWTRYA